MQHVYGWSIGAGYRNVSGPVAGPLSFLNVIFARPIQGSYSVVCIRYMQHVYGWSIQAGYRNVSGPVAGPLSFLNVIFARTIHGSYSVVCI